MISNWSVRNFKSIRDTVSLKFAPLTLFAGQNSSGKSTLIQSILLTTQTMQSGVASKSVILNGHIVKLGTFADIHSNSANTADISIDFELSPSEYAKDDVYSGNRRSYFPVEFHSSLSAIKCSYSFSASANEHNKELLQLQPRLETGAITFKSTSAGARDLLFSFQRSQDSSRQILERLGVDPNSVGATQTAPLEFQVTSYVPEPYNSRRYYRGPRSSKPAGVMLRHFLPTGLAVAYDEVAEQVEATYEALTEPEARYGIYGLAEPSDAMLSNSRLQTHYIESLERILQQEGTQSYQRARLQPHIEQLRQAFNLAAVKEIIQRLSTVQRKQLAQDLIANEDTIKRFLRNSRAPQNELTVIPIPDALAYSTEYVTSFFSERVKYLGPLRDEPKSVYPLSGHNDPNDVGFRGEHTAAVLDTHRNTDIFYIPSRGFPFSRNDERQMIPTTLGIAVRDWLAYIGIGDNVATSDKGKLGHELKIATSRGAQLHDLTHVGVGVSQALPIVVLSLLAEPGSTLIFEQPELHLHPKVQTRLADFFASLIFSGKQCIVETHSEYLVSRLRYLTALSDSTQISKSTKIYFVEKENDQSIYKEVEISPTGTIKKWPKGFFDESERNSSAIIEAQLKRARRL